MANSTILSIIASAAKQSSFSHDFPLLQRGIKGDFIMFLKSLLASLLQREELRRLVVLLSLFYINPTFATTSHNLYDAKGNMIASCSEKGCEYFIYQGVSRVGVVKNHQFTHQANGIDGKAGEMVRDQTGILHSELWVPDFHGSVIAKYAAEKSDRILFDAFGQVLNEKTNVEDCKDYHYTDKPRIGCTALHNFNARFYDPKIGRFITGDPVEQHNLNWFIYGNNNPLTFVDYTGKNAIVIKVLPHAKRYVPAAYVIVKQYTKGGSPFAKLDKAMTKASRDAGEKIVAALDTAYEYWNKKIFLNEADDTTAKDPFLGDPRAAPGYAEGIPPTRLPDTADLVTGQDRPNVDKPEAEVYSEPQDYADIETNIGTYSDILGSLGDDDDDDTLPDAEGEDF